MYRLCLFDSSEARDLASFLNGLRRSHWSLTSLAHRRQPEHIPLVKAEDLIDGDRRPNRIGTFLLKRNGRIISILQVDDKHGDGKVAVFSGVETLPEYQRRGIFWRSLGIPCIRRICESNFERLEAVTWSFNRKGIPLYKRSGFRAVPGTSLLMENHIPLILRHPSTALYFRRYDYIRTLRNCRSYGYDAQDMDALSVFEYRWESGEKELKILVDWQRRQIASIQCSDWAAWCFVTEETPFCIHYRLENRLRSDLPFEIHINRTRSETGAPQRLPANQVAVGDIQIGDPPEGVVSGVRVELKIGETRVPFTIRRFREIAEVRPTGSA